MNIGLTIILGTLLFAIAWFIYSEVLLFNLRRLQEKFQENVNSTFRGLFGGRYTRSHGTCYDKCLMESHWDPGCASMCRI